MSYPINTKAVQLGPCQIRYRDPDTGEIIAIGATTGGTKLSYEQKFTDIKIDQLGETVVKKILQGESASIEFTIAESGFEKLKLAMPFGNLYTNGSSSAFGIGSNAGGDLLEKSVELFVHPINTEGTAGTDDEDFISNDIQIWQAANASAVELSYAVGETRAYKVNMEIFPDFTRPAGQYLFIIGDPDAADSALTTLPSIKASGPADFDTSVAPDSDIEIMMNAPLSMKSTTQPNAAILLQDAETHAEIETTVTATQYVTGSAVSATSTTLTLASGAVTADDCFNGCSLEITGGTGASNVKIEITDTDFATNTLTVASWPAGTPVVGSAYKIYATKIIVSPISSLSLSTDYNLILGLTKGLNGQCSVPEVITFTTASS